MTRILPLSLLMAFVVVLLALMPEVAHEGGHISVARFLFKTVIILLAAKIGGELFESWKQPAVLGELVFGMILGNLYLLGMPSLEALKSDQALALFAEIGAILLLFEAGLESRVVELLEVGASATLVAVLGVIAPVLLRYFVSAWFLPESAWYVHLFAGTTLAATSVGITARVLKDLRRVDTKEARIILGAAVVDDVLGLIILAVVTGIVSSIASGASSEVSLLPMLLIIAKAVLFLAGAVVVGRHIGGKLLRIGAACRVGGMAVVLSVCFCFLLAGLAEVMGLASIVGAFAAGLVLDERHYEQYERLHGESFEEIVAPISSILVPVFFVLMGLRVDLKAFANVNVLQLAAGLSLAAILGKQVCALGVLEKGLNRLAVGVGMIPRGEVGLIFAGIGGSLMVAGKPVFSPEVFSSMIVMVMVTTLATPPLLKYVFNRESAPLR